MCVGGRVLTAAFSSVSIVSCFSLLVEKPSALDEARKVSI